MLARFFGCLALATYTLQAADWPMFRGDPALSGRSSDELPEAPSRLWTFKTGGPIKSSVAVAGGIAVVGSDDGKVYAIDTKSGQQKWAFEATGPIESSALILDGHAYIGDAAGKLLKIRLSDGKAAWTFSADAQILGAINWYRDQETGKTNVLFGSYDFSLYSVDAEIGSNQWRYATENYINGAPAIANGIAITGGCDGLLHVVDISTGLAKHTIEIGAYIAGSPVLEGDLAFLGHYGNGVVCADIAKGEVLWKFDGGKQPFFSSPALTPEYAIIGGRDRLIHALDRKTGESRWTFRTQGRVDSSPVIAGSSVIVGSEDGFLYMLDTRDGRERWSYELGAEVTASPAIADGVIYIGSHDGTLFAFGKESK